MPAVTMTRGSRAWQSFGVSWQVVYNNLRPSASMSALRPDSGGGGTPVTTGGASFTVRGFGLRLAARTTVKRDVVTVELPPPSITGGGGGGPITVVGDDGP